MSQFSLLLSFVILSSSIKGLWVIIALSYHLHEGLWISVADFVEIYDLQGQQTDKNYTNNEITPV